MRHKLRRIKGFLDAKTLWASQATSEEIQYAPLGFDPADAVLLPGVDNPWTCILALTAERLLPFPSRCWQPPEIADSALRLLGCVVDKEEECDGCCRGEEVGFLGTPYW
jgi:hypothetical protein